VAFCDFCDCQDCRLGRPGLTHAPTKDGRHICDICWRYTVCCAAKRREGVKRGTTGAGPCEQEVDGKIVPTACSHRPELVGPFVLLERDGEPSRT
jgi:hypothetical protein